LNCAHVRKLQPQTFSGKGELLFCPEVP
jgi:hypothetical protein